MNKKVGKYFIIFLLLVFELGLAQEKNPTVYPYGGVPDSSRFERGLMEKIPLNFKTSDFEGAQFHSKADFRGAQFQCNAYFKGIIFDSLAIFQDAVFNKVGFYTVRFNNEANFFRTKFKDHAYFSNITQFDSLANFEATTFDSSIDFMNANFMNDAIFRNGKCYGKAFFVQVAFYQKADFSEYRFFDLAKFKSSGVIGKTIFRNAKFYKDVDFRNSCLNGRSDFSFSRFSGRINFSNTAFNSTIDFRDAYFNEKSDYVNFSSARIIDTLFVGTIKWDNPQKFDLRLAKFMPSGQYKASVITHRYNSDNVYNFGTKQISAIGPGAKIVLCGPVELKIQYDQISHIIIPDKMDYFTKKFIIDGTKQTSFNSDEYKKERFELDYIFAKSTMYQDKSTEYVENRWYQVWKYPKWFLNTLYYLTMGLGYRPFRLLYWVLVLVIGYMIYFMVKFPGKITNYIAKDEKKRVPKKEDSVSRFYQFMSTLINCLYFSSMIFFTFRFKKDILNYFDPKEKFIIASEWFLGLLIYISFLTLSKSGSILHTLKSLFIG